MHVAVLGGGFQGCCTALQLARRGATVTLYDKQPRLLAGAVSASEGKIHLGYVYASDRSLATARTMLLGALSFEPLLKALLGEEAPVAISEPFYYAVHRDSQVDTEAFCAHLDAIHEILEQTPNRDDYFGMDLRRSPRRLSQAELEDRFDPRLIASAFETGEIAIDLPGVCASIRKAIADDPRIEVRSGCTIVSVTDADNRMSVRSTGGDGIASDSFETVVNTLWEGRLAIDATRDIHPRRPWIHRFKYGIRFGSTTGGSMPSVTLVLGPFGDLVDYGDGQFYLSWYPACMAASSTSLSPPNWQADPEDPLRANILEESFAAMAEIIPGLHGAQAEDVTVRGGYIVAWGSSDIDDQVSELHRRHEIGVHSHGKYHSIDSGKLTMVPYYAEICADRILPKRP
jgi:glycine/D-amino acid oxidase-like deaminating enzyme